MKLFTRLTTASALLTACLAATQANASIIDFGASPWTPGAHNLPSYTAEGVTATAGPTGKLLFAADPRDGLGIRSGEDDEIDVTEYLTIAFSQATNLLGINLTDFFPKKHDDITNDGSDASGEKGFISLWLESTQVGNDYAIYGANSWGSNGEQLVKFSGESVTQIKFWSAGAKDEFSVKSIVTVPEPGILSLISLGLLCLGLSRRREQGA